MLKIQNYKLLLVLAIAYFLLYHFYYARILELVTAKKISIGVQGEYLQEYIKRGRFFLWLMNFLTVFMIFIRVFFFASTLLLGTFLSNNVKLSFTTLLKMVLLSEFVFLLRDILVISFMLMSKDPDRPVVDASLSVSTLFSNWVRNNPVFALPASSISLYVFGYIFILSFILSKRKMAWGNSLKFVGSYIGISYIVCLLLSLSFNLYASN
jgi:hypothetical protein